eukprot:Nk52_evm97s221 gene=Nk52_evmTU97s221
MFMPSILSSLILLPRRTCERLGASNLSTKNIVGLGLHKRGYCEDRFLSGQENNSTTSRVSVFEKAIAVLKCSSPEGKIEILKSIKLGIQRGQELFEKPKMAIPLSDYSARPSQPLLVRLTSMPKMKNLKVSEAVYLLHTLAHIEMNAMDMYTDTFVRFAHLDFPEQFYRECLDVACDEASHFAMLSNRLKELGSFYGSIPAHGVLWDHAIATKNDIDARLAVVPLVQEARGLDAGPRLVARLQSMGDVTSEKIVAQIVSEEEDHVRFGLRWFEYSSQKQKKIPPLHFQDLVKKHFPKGIPGPFNSEARLKSGLTKDWYMPVSKDSLVSKSFKK